MSYSDESQEVGYGVNYKLKYRELKKHLRALIYENECFQDELKKAQGNLLSISRDKSFLLDRILKYEKPIGVSSDSEATESSEEDDSRGQLLPVQAPLPRKKITKRKRSEAELHNGTSNQSSDSLHGYLPAKVAKMAASKPVAGKPAGGKPANPRKRQRPPRKPAAKKSTQDLPVHFNAQVARGLGNMAQRPPQQQLHMGRITDFGTSHKFEFASDSQMTREDIERRLEARRYSPELELNTTATMPAELFSQDPGQESDLDGSEICDYTQMEDDGASADMVLE